MKKLKTRLCVVSAFLCISVLLSACSGNSAEKSFSEAGMSITLNEEFSSEEIEGADACFRSLASLIIVEKLEFDELKSEGLTSDSSIEDFSSYIIKYYELDEETTFQKHESGDFLYSEYTTFVQDGDYTFVPCLYKSNSAFWVVDFCCPQMYAEDSKADFLKWAETVKFDD